MKHTHVQDLSSLDNACSKTGKFVTYGEKDNGKSNEISMSHTLDSDSFPEENNRKMCEYVLSIYCRIRHGLTDTESDKKVILIFSKTKISHMRRVHKSAPKNV